MFSVLSMQVTLDSFQLRTLMCPGGYRLENIETRGDLWGCVCDNDIDQLLFCRDDQDTIVVEVRSIAPNTMFNTSGGQ